MMAWTHTIDMQIIRVGGTCPNAATIFMDERLRRTCRNAVTNLMTEPKDNNEADTTVGGSMVLSFNSATLLLALALCY